MANPMKKYAKCSRCGNEYHVDMMTRTESAKRGYRASYMCSSCATENEYYHTSNNKISGTKKVNNINVDIEFETTGTTDNARNLFFEYGFIPTHDGSLNNDWNTTPYERDEASCEYVSPIMQGLNRPVKFCVSMQNYIDKGEITLDESCGTHFHVSVNSMKDENGDKTYMRYIRRFYNSLFVPLCEEMKANPNATEQLFGRYFTDYAPSIDWETKQRPDHHSDRYVFINCLNDTNIEFRLNKFVSASQYQSLMRMEVEMVKAIVSNFCENFNTPTDKIDSRRYYKKLSDGTKVVSKTAYRKHKADMTAQKLVKIFRKYAGITE